MTASSIVQTFNSLKPNQRVRITSQGPMESMNHATLRVGRRSYSKKYGVEKLPLINPRNPNGVRYFLYKRGEDVTLAHGDMAACLVDIQPE